MTGKTDEHRTIREIYRNSSERISLAIKLFGKQKPDGDFDIPPVQDFDTITNLINSVAGSQRFEGTNNYRAAILDVGSWVLHAFTREYLERTSDGKPKPMPIIKKGIEVLHLLLHRDLRRKQLSPTESQVYYSFLTLSKQLPDFRKTPLTQDEIDNHMDNLITRKIS